MITRNFLIIGFGSSGKRYARLLKKLKFKKNIYIISDQNHPFKKINYGNSLSKIKFEMIIICSETSRHYEDLKKIDKLPGKIKILVEKPLFSKNYNYKPLNKNISIGYNLRFDPIITYIKKKIRNEKVNYIFLNCLSYLPSWRKNINYKKSYSSFETRGGGVTNDLSHEIDLANYLVGIDKTKFSFKGNTSTLKIQSDDFSHFYGISKNKSPIFINLGFFFQIEKRQIFLKTKNKSYILSFDERKIVEFSNGKKTTKYFNLKNKDFTYLEMIKSILNNKYKTCCNYKEGLFINKLISKYKKS